MASERENLERAVLEKRLTEKRATDAAKNAEVSTGEKAEAALSGFGDSATFGYLPEIQAGTYQAAEEIADALGVLPGRNETYEESLAHARGEKSETEGKAPGYALGGTLAGSLVPGTGVFKGAQLGAKALKGARLAKAGKGAGMAEKAAMLSKGRSGAKYGAEKLLGGIAGKGTKMQQAKALGTLGAVEGAAYNPGENGSRVENALLGAAIGGAIPGVEKVVGAGVDLLKKTPSMMGWVGRKALSNLGVEDQVMKDYLENPEILTNAGDFESVMNSIDDIVRPIRQELSEAKISKKEAEKRFSRARDIIKTEIRDETGDIDKAFNTAKKQLDVEYRTSLDQLNKVKPPLELTDSVIESVEQLKRNVVMGSKRALDTLLDEAPEGIDINGIASGLDDHVDRLSVRGVMPEEYSGHANSINSLMEDVAKFGGEMTPYEIKKYIQQLDSRIDYGEREAGQFLKNPFTEAMVDLRRSFDAKLKTFPGYAREMEAVSGDAQLLSESRKLFGRHNKAISTLSTLDKPANETNRVLLERLGQRTGNNYKEPVVEYLTVKNQLKDLKYLDGKEKFMSDLDGYEEFAVAKARKGEIDAKSEMQKKAEMERRIAESEAAKEAQLETVRLENAKSAAEQIRTFTGLNTADKMQSLMGVLNSGKKGNGITLRQEFEKLSQMSDVDFESMVQSLRMQGNFDKTFLRGSRNVNLFGMMGMAADSLTSRRSGMGALAGGAFLGGPVGLIIGGATGAMVDLYGPAMTKRILDQVITLKGIPTRTKIMELSLPPEVTKDLIRQFEVYALTAAATHPTKVAQEDIPVVRDDIRRNMDMNNIQKAKAINSLNKRGEIDDINAFIGQPMTPEEIFKEKKGPASGYPQDDQQKKADVMERMVQ